jgi:arginine:pyruvate transaminase
MKRRFAPIVDWIAHEGGVDPWAIHWEARQAKDRGEDVIILSVGDPPIDTPAPVVDRAVSALRSGDTHYTEILGKQPLRERIAAMHAERTGSPCAAENVAVLAGTQNGLFVSSLCLASHGDEIITIDPMYTTYPASIQASGAKLVRVPARAANGFHPDLKALEAAITPSTRAIFLATPNNPTGVVLSETDCDSIAAIARRYGLWIVSDEVYAGIADNNRVPSLAARLPDQVVTVGSLSKSHAMTGWRVGWMIGPADLIRLVDELALCMLYGIPGFIQEAAIAAMDIRHDTEREMHEYCRVRRDVLYRSVADIPGVRACWPDAGMFMLLDIRETGLSSAAFLRGLFETEKVSLLDGAAFGRETDGFVRACFAAEPAELEEAGRRIRRYAAGLISQ